MRIDAEEFDIMVDELLNQDPISYSMLCKIAEKVLKKRVDYWCSVKFGNKRQINEDLLQNIYLQLILKTVDYFLLKDGPEGEVNRDPEGFEKWIGVVALNESKAFFKKIRSYDFAVSDIEDDQFANLPDYSFSLSGDDQELTARCVGLVVSGKGAIYKKLSWLCVGVMMLRYGFTKIEATRKFVDEMSCLTLSALFDRFLADASAVDWLELDDSIIETITDQLNELWDGNTAYKDVVLNDFFMKKGPNGSVSDWINRINSCLEKNLDREGET